MSRILTYREALGEAIGEEMERNESVFLFGEDVGAYGGAYRGLPGSRREIRRPQGDRRPPLGIPHRRRRGRGARHRPAADRRDHVHQFTAPLRIGPDNQPGGKIPFHDRRSRAGPTRHPHAAGHGTLGPHPALAEPGVMGYAHPGPEGESVPATPVRCARGS